MTRRAPRGTDTSSDEQTRRKMLDDREGEVGGSLVGLQPLVDRAARREELVIDIVDPQREIKLLQRTGERDEPTNKRPIVLEHEL